jgi:hypothetical protein
MLVGRLMESWVIALLSALVGGAAAVVSWSFWIGRNAVTKDDLDKATAATATEIHSLQSEIASHSREVGETITALRTHVSTIDRDTTAKITQVELYIRDTFVRRDSWHTAMNQLQERWAAGEKAAEERSLRLEGKVDKLVERLLEGK